MLYGTFTLDVAMRARDLERMWKEKSESVVGQSVVIFRLAHSIL
jgi:hypothetical protein